MMRISKFKPSHLEDLNSWLTQRGREPVGMNDLAKVGYVIHHQKTPIAVLFLRKCEGNAGILDGLCTNPGASSLDRHVAIDLLIEKVMTMAQQKHLTKLIAFTSDSLILERVTRLGFSTLNSYSIVVRSL